jgi:hypothetical protein
MTVLDITQSGCFGMQTASRRLHWDREQASLVRQCPEPGR